MSQQLRQARRELAIQMYQRGGYRARDIAVVYNASVRSVQRWIRAFKTWGYPAILARPIPGRPPKLSAETRAQLVQLLQRGPRSAGFAADAWSHSLVAKLIASVFGVSYHRDYIGALLRSIGWGVAPAPPPPGPQPYPPPPYPAGDPNLR